MPGKLHGTPPIEPAEAEVVERDIPGTSDAHELAMSIAEHPQVVGSIVIVLSTDGTLRVGMGIIDDEDVKKALLPIAETLKAHIDANYDPKTTSGVFADDESRN
jgi:hypothetical protein